MTRFDELADRAGVAVRDRARELAGDPPSITMVARRRHRRRTVGLSISALVIAVGVVAAAVLSNAGPTGISIEDVAGPTEDASRDTRATEARPTDAPLLFAAGWSAWRLPRGLTAGTAEVVPASGGMGAFAFGRDLVVEGDEGWAVESDLLPDVPDVLAVGDVEGERWIIAITDSVITVYDNDRTPLLVDDVPVPLRSGALGAAWRGDAFVIVAPAEEPGDGNPSYLLDPVTGRLTEIGRVPLGANQMWNSAVVGVDGTVLLVGTWLDPSSNAPGRPTLGAAALPAGSDRWSLVPGGVLSPQSADAVALGDTVLVVDYEGRAAEVSAAGWTPPVETGLAASECGTELAYGNGMVLAVGCTQAATYDSRSGGWTRIAVPTSATGVSLFRPVATADGFLVANLEWDDTGSRLVAGAFLHLHPERTWPLVAGHAGHRLAAPPGWQVAEERLTPNLNSPVELVTAGTGPMPIGGGDCAQIPEAALEALGPDDALVSIQRDGEPSGSIPTMGGIEALLDRWTGTAFVDCLSNADDAVVYWTAARWGPEQLHVLVAHHRNAPDDVIDQALVVANSYTSD